MNWLKTQKQKRRDARRNKAWAANKRGAGPKRGRNGRATSGVRVKPA